MSHSVADELEELEIKLKALEERVGSFEKNINEVTSEVRNVLIDIRSTLSELDNPFNYLKELGLESLLKSTIEEKLSEFVETRLKDLKKKLEEKIAKAKIPTEQNEEQATIPTTQKMPETQQKVRQITRKETQLPLKRILGSVIPQKRLTLTQESYSAIPLDEVLGLLSCAGCLIYIFGKRGAEKILDEYTRRGWIPDDVKLALLRASSILRLEDVPEEKEVGIEDHLIAMYLLNKLCDGAPLTEFLVVLLLLSKYAGFPFILKKIMSETRR